MSDALHPYRSHTCNALRASDVGTTARVSGWINRRREHAGPLFIDLRDHYGVTQCVVLESSPHYDTLKRIKLESVVTLTGRVMKGWAMIEPEGVTEDADLRRFVDMAIMFCAALPPKQGT